MSIALAAIFILNVMQGYFMVNLIARIAETHSNRSATTTKKIRFVSYADKDTRLTLPLKST